MNKEIITEEALRSYARITPEIASRYLQGEFSAQALRVYAQHQRCAFMSADRADGSSRWTYHINVGRLIAYKEGRIDMRGAAIGAGA